MIWIGYYLFCDTINITYIIHLEIIIIIIIIIRSQIIINITTETFVRASSYFSLAGIIGKYDHVIIIIEYLIKIIKNI